MNGRPAGKREGGSRRARQFHKEKSSEKNRQLELLEQKARPADLARPFNILFYPHHRLMNSARQAIFSSFYREETGAQSGPTVGWNLGTPVQPGDGSSPAHSIFDKSTHCISSPFDIHLESTSYE